MNRIAQVIASPNFFKKQRIGFSVWAHNSPKTYLAEYKNVKQEISEITNSREVIMVAFVDNILPMIVFDRSQKEQDEISREYLKKLPEFGFNEVYLVSDFVLSDMVWEYLKKGKSFTISKFFKNLPRDKREIKSELSMKEIIEFLWHIYVLENSFTKYNLNGFVCGVRSKKFYLAVREKMISFDLYVVNNYI